MKIFLAPMEGLTDFHMRDVLTRIGGYDACVTEFIRVTDRLLPARTFLQACPELRMGGRTRAGTPVHLQLLGSEPAVLADNAARAAALGAPSIDLNFGCPAKEVTGALSGSALMRDLALAERLIDAAVSATARPVTLKMRLGWDHTTLNAPELAERAEQLGVRAITVHGRTRQQFYTGRADWSAVAEVKRAVHIPVVVNGDIVDAGTAREALHQSGADAVMLGRGLNGRPWAAAAIERALNGGPFEEPGPEARLTIVLEQLRASLAFYGESLGLKMFRKHLGWSILAAPWPRDPVTRRAAKAELCRLATPSAVEAALTRLWSAPDDRAQPREAAGRVSTAAASLAITSPTMLNNRRRLDSCAATSSA